MFETDAGWTPESSTRPHIGCRCEADARNHEESEANAVLKVLERSTPGARKFDSKLAEFEKAVDSDEAEVSEEFPLILECDATERQTMGSHMLAAERRGTCRHHTGSRRSLGPAT